MVCLLVGGVMFANWFVSPLKLSRGLVPDSDFLVAGHLRRSEAS